MPPECRPRVVTPLALVGSWTLVGAATGLRSSMGLAAVLTGGRRLRLPGPLETVAARRASWLVVVGELIADKLPSIPSRTMPGGLVPRLVLGGGSAGLLARSAGAPVVPAALLGSGTALAAAFAGAAGRRRLAERIDPTAAALLEDALAVTLAIAALRLAGGRPGRSR